MIINEELHFNNGSAGGRDGAGWRRPALHEQVNFTSEGKMEMECFAIQPEWAQFKGGERPKRDPRRNCFQVDRDRILYSSAYRRLSSKTQIFVSGAHDHLRTRLTHTNEVVQIARTIGRCLHLNEDLIEAIAFGHDLGHAPFGHTGELALHLILSGCDNLDGLIEINFNENRGFKHNLQSLRIVDKLEKRKWGKEGLCLSNFTRFGIVNHTQTKWNISCDQSRGCRHVVSNHVCIIFPQGEAFSVDHYDIFLEEIQHPAISYESFVVAIADEISQRHHDLEDGIVTKLIGKDEAIRILEDIKPFKYYDEIINELRKNKNSLGPEFASRVSTIIVGQLTNRVINSSRAKLRSWKSKNLIESPKRMYNWLKGHSKDDLENEMASCICYPESFVTIEKYLKDILKNRILNSYMVQRMDGKGRYVIRKLFKAYMTNPQQLPDTVILRISSDSIIMKMNKNQSAPHDIGEARDVIERLKTRLEFQPILARNICDHISGMTDLQALEEHSRLYSSHEDVVELR